VREGEKEEEKRLIEKWLSSKMKIPLLLFLETMYKTVKLPESDGKGRGRERR